MHGPYGWGYGGSGMWIGMILFWLFFLLILVGIGLFIWWLVSAQTRPQRHIESSAMEILKERYAKGEISKEEFEEKKKDLS